MTTTNRTISPSEKQLETYYRICADKKIAPKDTSKFSGREISVEIEKLIALPNPATDAQINLLRDMINEMVDANVPGVKPVSNTFYQALNAKTIQDWITNARTLRAKNFDLLPANEQQIERIADMYLFPDVEWECVAKNIRIKESTFDEDGYATKRNINYQETVRIERKIMLEEEIYNQNGERVQAWRFMTREEFKTELKNKLTHAQASMLIDKYEVDFRNWMRSRVTDYQRNTIKTLEARMANIFVPKEVTAFEMDMPFDMDAVDTNVEQEVDAPFSVNSKKLDNWNPVSYVPLTEEQITMLSREEADQYIITLRRESRDRDLRSSTNAQDLSGDFEDMRTAQDDSKAKTKEFQNLNNFLFGLSDVVGSYFEVDNIGVESLRHEALQIFFDKNNGATQEKKDALRVQIMDFMRMAVLGKAIKFTGLMNLADRSEIASDLIDELCEDSLFAKQLIKLQREQF